MPLWIFLTPTTTKTMIFWIELSCFTFLGRKKCTFTFEVTFCINKSSDFAQDVTPRNCQSRLGIYLAATLNKLATSIRISLEPQGWLRLLLTIPQSGIPISVSFLLFFLGKNKKKNYFCGAIAPPAGPTINQSGKLWHTAQLAALTWYITQAVAAACSTAKSSGESRLMQRLCWLLALKAIEVSNLFLSSLI